MNVEQLAGSCGAVVNGIDLTKPQSTGVIEQLWSLLDEHLVIALPGQEFDLDRLEALTDELGGRDITPYVKPVDGRPYVIRVIKEPDDELNFANAWHSDLSYLAEPPAYTLLHARDVPAFGGDTMWANQYAAFDTLPPAVRERLCAVTATHSAGMAYGTGGYLESVADKSSMAIEPSAEAHEVQHHPAVISHPRTGRAALYLNSVYTTALTDVDGDGGSGSGDSADDAALLAGVVLHSTHPNFTCRLRWEPGMLAIWDNRTTQHFAINDYAGARRELYRTSVKGSRPVAANAG